MAEHHRDCVRPLIPCRFTYDIRERKLVVSEAEASTVRMILQRYAELGSVALLKAELERAGIVSKRREGAGNP